MRGIIFSFLMSLQLLTVAQEKIELYPKGIPNTKENVSIADNMPEFYFYKPEKQLSDKVFLIIPGGGYGIVAMNHEGHDVAKRLQALGYAAFVLRYRLPKDAQIIDKRIGPIQDAQKALAIIRENSAGINVGSVGVIGFSAGGHLASTLSTHFNTAYVDEIDKGTNLRPDFSVLVYPVITMEEGVTHLGSKNNLIGPNFNAEDVKRFSNELNVNTFTQPTYLVHAKDDKVVPIENAYRYKKALDAHKVPNKLYQYELGGHGFGMFNKQENGDWFADMINWLKTIN